MDCHYKQTSLLFAQTADKLFYVICGAGGCDVTRRSKGSSEKFIITITAVRSNHVVHASTIARWPARYARSHFFLAYFLQTRSI